MQAAHARLLAAVPSRLRPILGSIAVHAGIYFDELVCHTSTDAIVPLFARYLK